MGGVCEPQEKINTEEEKRRKKLCEQKQGRTKAFRKCAAVSITELPKREFLPQPLEGFP